MATVIPLISGSITTPPVDHDGVSGQLPLRFKVTGLAVGEDATRVTGIPQRFSTITIEGITYGVDRVSASPVFDGEADVTVMSSTDGRFRFPLRTPAPSPTTREWGLTFQRENIRAPFFVREAKEYYIQANDGSTFPETRLIWENKPIEVPVDFAILTRTVYLFGLTDEQIRNYCGIVLGEIGNLHQFTLATLSFWQYLAPTMILRQTADSTNGGSMEITYTWKADPGNGPQGINSPNQNIPGATRATIGRSEFFTYQVASNGDGNAPIVFTIDQFPALDYDENGDSFPNPYRNYDGWETLPGNPLG